MALNLLKSSISLFNVSIERGITICLRNWLDKILNVSVPLLRPNWKRKINIQSTNYLSCKSSTLHGTCLLFECVGVVVNSVFFFPPVQVVFNCTFYLTPLKFMYLHVKTPALAEAKTINFFRLSAAKMLISLKEKFTFVSVFLSSGSSIKI